MSVKKTNLLRESIRQEMRRQGLSIGDVVAWNIKSRNAIYGWFRGEHAMGDDTVAAIMEKLRMQITTCDGLHTLPKAKKGKKA